jgi:hypothetical protein
VRRGTLILVLVVVLILGGFLMIALLTSGPQGALPVRVQTNNPEASTVMATPTQALAFIIFAAIALGSLAGGGVVLSLVFRFLDREITRNREE